MRSRISGFFHVAMLLAALVANSAWAQTANVSGRVTDEAGGAALQGAVIQVRNRTTFQLVANPSTNANGDFAAAVPSGTYLVSADAAGYRRELFDNIPCGQSCDLNAAASVVVAAPTAVPGLDFALLRLGSISGRVVRADNGAPLVGVTVNAVALDGFSLAGASTSATGDYTIDIEPGSVRLYSSNEQAFVDELLPDIACAFAVCDPAGGSIVTVASGQAVAGFDFALARGGTVQGVVTRATTGTPIDVAVRVEIYRPDGTLLTAPETDVDGVWRVTSGMLTGSYRAIAVPLGAYAPEVWDNRPCGLDPCNANTGDPIPVTAPAATTGIDFALVRTDAALSGRVTALAGGSPLSDVAVRALPQDGGTPLETTTDGNGNWAIGALPAGTYTVRAIAPPPLLDEIHPNVQCGDPFNPNACAGTGAPLTVVAGQEIAGIDFALAIAGSVEVALRNADTLAVMAGVIEAALPGFVLPRAFDAASANTVVIPVLNGGNVRLRGRASACGALGDMECLAERFANDPCPHFACDITAGAPIAVAKGATVTGIELELVAGASIAGDVTTLGGAPIESTAVQILDALGSIVTSATTQADGTYVLRGLGVGPYFARTSAPFPFRDELYDNVPCAEGQCSLALGTALTPTLGQTLGGIHFALIEGGTIAGTVRDQFALPIAASVTIFNGGGAIVTSTSTDAASGQYDAAGLDSGSYFVRFVAPGRDAKLFDNLPCANGECDPTAGTPVPVSTAQVTSGINAVLPGNGLPLPTQIAFLNRCVGGCTLFPGAENSRTNRSSIIGNSIRNLPAYPWGDASFNALAACVRNVFRPYRIEIVTDDPGNVPHREHMAAGSPADLGFGNSTNGVSPYACGGIANSISFTFAQRFGDNIPELCYVASHEIGHQFGLDHELHAPDPMTYLDFPSLRTFTRTSEPCGEFSSRPCACDAPAAQNTHAILAARIGIDPVVFRDSFEATSQGVDNAWQSYRSPFPAQPDAPPGVCGTDPVRAARGTQSR